MVLPCITTMTTNPPRSAARSSPWPSAAASAARCVSGASPPPGYSGWSPPVLQGGDGDMYVCMHACMYVVIFTWEYICDHIYIYICVYIYIYIHTCIMGIYPPIWYDMIIYSKLIGPDVCPEMGALPPASWPWLKNNRWCLPTHDVFLRDLIYPQLVH